MANPHKGEVAFKAGDENYTLSFSANALCELEDMLGVGVNDIGAMLADPAKIRMKQMRTVFHAGLLDHHPDMDEKTMKVVFSKLRAGEAVGYIAKAFALAFPEAEGGAAGPQTPGQDGSGQPS